MMRTRLPRIGLAAALAALIFGCQPDNGVPTEVERSLGEQGLRLSAPAADIYRMIDELLPRGPARLARTQFTAIVLIRNRRPGTAMVWGQELIDFLLGHYERGRWQDSGGGSTGELIAAIAAYVGLGAEAEAAVACVPGVDCEVVATGSNEFAGSAIPGDMIDQPFILYLVRLPDDSFAPPLFPLFYEIHTIPEGITFPPSSPSGSLSLSQADDGPVAGLCALDADDPLGVPADAVAGSNLFIAHRENGEWEQLPYVPVTFLDCQDASSETESAGLWMRPFEYALDLVSPNALIAGGRGLGGAISSFSPFGALYTGPIGPLATTSTVAIVEGRTTFFDGERITFRAVVDPAPDDAANGRVVFLATDPIHGPGAPVEEVVDGEAVQPFTCGSNRVPFGSHTAKVQFLGTSSHEPSTSNTLAYECLESAGE